MPAPEAMKLSMTEYVLRRFVGRAARMALDLRCDGCGKEGADMALVCCRDADCTAGYFGIDADEVKSLLDEAERLMPGLIAELQAPPPTRPDMKSVLEILQRAKELLPSHGFDIPDAIAAAAPASGSSAIRAFDYLHDVTAWRGGDMRHWPNLGGKQGITEAFDAAIIAASGQGAAE